MTDEGHSTPPPVTRDGAETAENATDEGKAVGDDNGLQSFDDFLNSTKGEGEESGSGSGEGSSNRNTGPEGRPFYSTGSGSSATRTTPTGTTSGDRTGSGRGAGPRFGAMKRTSGKRHLDEKYKENDSDEEDDSSEDNFNISDSLWMKISCGIYMMANIPYLLTGIYLANFWSTSERTAIWLELTGAFMFLIDGVLQLWLSIHLSDGDTCCRDKVLKADDPKPLWVERWPYSGVRLRTANWFLFGSILYVSAMLFYIAAPIAYYWGGYSGGGLYITAAAIFVVHAIDCIIGTLIYNAEPGARNLPMSRWQDRDWYLWGDITFLAVAIFDVYSNFYLERHGTFVSCLGWIANAFIYTIAAFADDASEEEEATDALDIMEKDTRPADRLSVTRKTSSMTAIEFE